MICIWIKCALEDGVPKRSFLVAVVVGAVLNLINHGDQMFAGETPDWTKIALTFCVPYFVATYGAVSFCLRRMAIEPGS